MFAVTAYKIKRFIFRWNAEPEEEGGSIVLSICGVIHLAKYKESTLIYFGRQHGFKPARKHVKAFREN